MIRYILFALALISVACTPKKTDTASDSDLTNTSGTQSLFDGTSMKGWAMFRNTPNNSWEVKDGMLHCKASDSASQRSDIRTAEQYGDFELTVDWKIPGGANSGIIYRSSEAYDNSFVTGPEYQLIDDVGYPEKLEDWQLTGACYAMYAAPANKKLNPAGEWNTTRIIAIGNHVEHWLNGQKLFEYEINSPEWNTLRDKSKWKEEREYGQLQKGYIVLQDHGNEAWFRNISIRPL